MNRTASTERTEVSSGNWAGQAWTITKPQVESTGGIVAAQNGEAARVGAAVLEQGGNAMDAAVATVLALSVVEPWLSGLGGGGFLLHATAEGVVEALDFNLRAPGDADIKDYPLSGGKSGDWFNWPSVHENRNLAGPLSVCVPGVVAGLAEALQRHGCMSWSSVLEPVVALAERGMRIDWFAELALAIDAPGLSARPAAASLFLDESRRVSNPRDSNSRLLPMPRMASMLRRLADKGPREFYEGQTASILLDSLNHLGSRLALDDLSTYQPEWKQPAHAAYRGREIFTIPGLSGGPSLLRALSTLAEHDLKSASEAEAAVSYAHAIREAYENRLLHMGHAAGQGDCTSHVSVIDAHGNMVSLTNTLLSRFGSKVLVPGLDLLLNNGMMWFDPRPGRPNCIEGGAKPLANMSPVITMRNGAPDIAIGAAGGRQIFPAILQLLSAMIDQGLSPEKAVHRPRIDASTPTILINRAASKDTATAIAAHYPMQMIEDSLYPVRFAIPSLVQSGTDGSPNVGAVHPNSPWAAAVPERLAC